MSVGCVDSSAALTLLSHLLKQGATKLNPSRYKLYYPRPFSKSLRNGGCLRKLLRSDIVTAESISDWNVIRKHSFGCETGTQGEIIEEKNRGKKFHELSL